MDWIKSIWAWLRNLFTLISRVMRLEERLSTLEKKMETIEAPPKDAREGLEYNKELNFYADKTTGERFCPVCLGNGKKITVNWHSRSDGEGWQCGNCKTSKWTDRGSLPRYRITE